MSASRDLEAAKQLLQKTSASLSGASLYSHLVDVIAHVIADPSADPAAAFDRIDASSRRSAASSSSSTDASSAAAAAASNAATARWAASVLRLQSPAGEDEEAAAPDAAQDLPNVVDALEWSGAAVGREEAVRIFFSMRKLAVSAGASQLRFWGKLLGTERDYFVVEGVKEDDEDDSDGKQVEGANGANKYTYWVCNSIGEEWTKLPRVRPEHVTGARKIRRFLTGRLDAPVRGHPPFPGAERELLRAQIARITSATFVSPDGVFKVSDDSPTAIEPAEEVPDKEMEELKAVGGWVHARLEVNVLGRCLPIEKTDESGEPIQDEETSIEQIPPLRSLEEDGEGSWATFACPSSAPGAPPSVACIRSMRWPGATAVAFGKRFVNLYVGYGLKQTWSAYAPAVPSDLQDEFNDPEFKEQEDVTTNPEPDQPADGGDDAPADDDA